MIASKVLSVLAVVGVAAAQRNNICSQSTATINSQADADQYANCSTISGNIVIGPSASGIISMDGPVAIDGDLSARNAGGLTSFGSTSLGRITGKFELFNLTLLTTLSFAQLTAIDEISWSSLPRLGDLTFTQDVKTASKVLVTNTFLRSLNGINLDAVKELDINNNGRLTEFSTQVSNITESVTIDSNNEQLKVSFPNLIWAANITIKNASSVSIPSLARVNGSIGFYGNYFEELLTPNLTTVGSSLSFVGNAKLRNVTLPVLTSIGGTNLIANNSALTSISFPLLETVGGAIDFSGNFTNVSLAALDDVKGAFNLQSTAQINCGAFQRLKSGNTIQGSFTCRSAAADARSRDGSNGSGSGSGSGTSSSDGSSPAQSPGAAMSYGPNAAVAGLSVIGGILGMLL